MPDRQCIICLYLCLSLVAPLCSLTFAASVCSFHQPLHSGDGLLDFEEFCKAFAPLLNEDGSMNNQTILTAESSVLTQEVNRLRKECWEWQQKCIELESRRENLVRPILSFFHLFPSIADRV